MWRINFVQVIKDSAVSGAGRWGKWYKSDLMVVTCATPLTDLHQRLAAAQYQVRRLAGHGTTASHYAARWLAGKIFRAPLKGPENSPAFLPAWRPGLTGHLFFCTFALV